MATMSTVAVLKKALEQVPSVRLAVLFGSAARRTAGRASDVDVGLLLGRETEPSSALAVALERAVGGPVDIIWLDTAPSLLRFEIARDGLVVVERESYAWADFRARAMIDWWDWEPTARMMHRVMIARLREEATRGPS
jgi:predicted nucleotidyltransferase